MVPFYSYLPPSQPTTFLNLATNNLFSISLILSFKNVTLMDSYSMWPFRQVLFAQHTIFEIHANGCVSQ